MTYRELRIVLGAAVATCGTVLVWSWPSVTDAQAIQQQAAAKPRLGLNETRLGAVIASAEIVRDPKSPTRYLVEVRLRNTSREREALAPVHARVDRVEHHPMARAMPMPQAVWSHKDQVRVPADKTVVRRYVLPARMAREVAKALSEKPRVNDPMGPTIRYFARVSRG